MNQYLVDSPYTPFTIKNQFKAISNGKVFIGEVDKDPLNPSQQIQAYVVNESGTNVPVSQPISLNAGGYLVYNGQVSKFVTLEPYSMVVLNNVDVEMWRVDDISKVDPDSINHASLNNINAVGGHDAIYDRTFVDYEAMISYSGHENGLRYSTGGTTWEVNTATGAPLGVGLFVKPLNSLCVLDFGISNIGLPTSQDFRDMYAIASPHGWLDFTVPAGVYLVDALLSPDEYKTGWLVPWDGIFQYSPVVRISIDAGAFLLAGSNDMIIIRGCKDNIKIEGAGEFDANGFSNVIHAAFCPEDLNQPTTKVSQQFCSFAPTLSAKGGYAGVMTQSGPTVLGQDSGSYNHTIGGRFLGTSYPFWGKNTLTTTQNITTRTTLVGINAKDIVSAAKIDCGEIRLLNSNFEGMSGEVIEFKLKGDPAKIIENSLHIEDTIFEVYAAATQLNQYGITIGANTKFIGTVIGTSGISTPLVFPSRVVFGSANGMAVSSHATDTIAVGPTNTKTITEILDGVTGVYSYSAVNVNYVDWLIRSKFNFLELNALPFDLSKGAHVSTFGHGVYIGANNDGTTYFNQQEGPVGANYKLHYMANAGGTPVYEVRGNGAIYNLTGTYGMLSDERTKKEFTPCRDYTEDLMKIEVGTYISLIDDSKCIGVNAGDFKKIFPSLVPVGGKPIMVNGEEIENPLHVNQSPLIYMLIDAFKRQEMKIREQEYRLTNLEKM